MGVQILTESNADLGRNNLSVLITYESMSCALFAIIHWVAAGVLYSNEDALIVYGVEFVSIGGYMVFLGFAALLYGVAGLYAAKHHNRVIIIVCMILQALSMAAEVAMAYSIWDSIEPEFDIEVLDDCSQQLGAEDSEDDVCDDFFSSNRTIALWNLWQHWYTNAESSNRYDDVLRTVQSGYTCCGFSRPQMCRVNRTLSPDSVNVYEAGTDSVNACGLYSRANGEFQPNERWYPATDYCRVTVTFDSFIFVGGCPFDLPYGESCVATTDYGTDPYASGCASAVQDYLNRGIVGVPDAMIFMAVVQSIFIVTLLCFFFKRKMTDVTPVQGWQKMSDGFDD